MARFEESVAARGFPAARRVRRPMSASLGALELSRSSLFAALLAIGFANGISEKVFRSVADDGFALATLNTFGLSIILWGACFIGLATLIQAPSGDAFRRADLAVIILAGLAFLAPVPAMSWLGLSLIAIHLHTTASDAMMRRAATIIFALTIPLFWTRILFAAFSDTILHLDARLVSWIVGTVPVGNVVPLADGSGSLFIAPGCSSLSNLSLAILSAAVFVAVRGGRWRPSAIGWTFASAVGVVVINVARIGWIGLDPSHYDLIHGPVGSTIAGWLTFAVIVTIGYLRIGRDAPLGY